MLMCSLFLSLHGETQSVPNVIIDNSMPFPTQVFHSSYGIVALSRASI